MRSYLRRLLRLTLPVLGLAALPSFAFAQDAADAAPLRLGTIAFENSGAPEAQAAFDRGMLLMHSFEYGPAATAFREAQEIDPAFAMAYWGEAMTYNHPVWMQQDRDAALEALNRFAPTPAERAERAGPAGGGTEREAAYMRAVDVLYGSGDEPPADKQARDDAYAEAMAALYAAYPDDEDAAAFDALAILGTAHEGRDFATYMKAAAILEEVVDDHPDHPGIAHYLIHSYDDPIHAPLGLRAARAYSKIAPDAGHAQHMTSHIFVALGMWDDVVAANENAMRVVDAAMARRGRGPWACGHYNFWLEYGYLQQGRTDDALRLVRECYDRVMEAAGGDAPDPDNSPIGSYAQMLSRYVVDTDGAATPALGWDVDYSAAPHAGVTAAFAHGFAAAAAGDAEGVAAARAALTDARAALSAEAEEDAGDGSWAKRNRILGVELEALQLSLAGESDAAIDIARRAAEMEAAMPFEFGPPFIDAPTHELLGRLLLAAGRADEAREAYATALSRTPNRVQAERGLEAAEAETVAAGAAD
ncbi:MAG: hypothetical protein PVF05_10755 [Gemmatimonadales bacterium]|jgi:tetratricopeptide (TPR) repeat protein